jgi:hypothetical protein
MAVTACTAPETLQNHCRIIDTNTTIPSNPISAFVANFSKAVPEHIIEQYKIYVTDLGVIGSQFGTTQTFFLAIVSALIAVFAFKETIRPIREYLSPAYTVIFGLMGIISVTWYLVSEQYRYIIGSKFCVLRDMEKTYPDLYPLFTKQSEQYVSGIIPTQSMLELFLGVAALLMATFGAIWQIRAWNAERKSSIHSVVINEGEEEDG